MDNLNLYLTNALAESYELANLWMPELTAFETGYNIYPYYQRHGGEDSGDPSFSARKLTLKKKFVDKNQDDYISSLNEIFYLLRYEARPSYVEERRSGYRQRVCLAGGGDRPREGSFRHAGEQSISMHLLDAVWETIDAVVTTSSGWMNSGESLTVTNTGKMLTECEIQLVPQGINQSFSLYNSATQEGLSFASASFIPGTVLIIDGRGRGLVELNETNMKGSLVEGSSFIRLKRGVNNILYSSSYGDVQMQVTFRPQEYEV